MALIKLDFPLLASPTMAIFISADPSGSEILSNVYSYLVRRQMYDAGPAMFVAYNRTGAA